MKRLPFLLPSVPRDRSYSRDAFVQDMIAAVIVAIMLIPQSLAYALLAGLPPEVGLYASIVPLAVYALLGTSSTLSVGPVAITSLLTATALADLAEQGTVDYLAGAVMLAALSGAMLALFGILRFGILANFLSHSVVQAFVSASAIIIALSQFKHLLGVQASGDNFIELIYELATHLPGANVYALLIGLAVLGFLLMSRTFGGRLLGYVGMTSRSAGLLVKTAPVIAVLLTIAAVLILGLDEQSIAIVGAIPAGLPMFSLPEFSFEMAEALLIPALLISIIGYVESISVGRTLGARRREGVNNNRELIALGGANLAASLSGGFPVTGGFSRSVVNFDAGARTQLASLMTAALIAVVALFLTPFLYYLPKVTLAATIIVAVIPLIDLSVIRQTWSFSKSDWSAVMATLLLTLGLGVEAGVTSGVLISIGLHLYRTAQPHVAEVGLVKGTEHFRNVRRYKVTTNPAILNLRIDESLFFANAAMLEELIYRRVANDDRIAHVVLMFSAVNDIDFSALETLHEINNRLQEEGIFLHLSEVKGPVLDKLRRTHFLEDLSGGLYLTQHQAFEALTG